MGDTNIGFTAPTSGHVRLEIFDVTGRLVATLVDQHLERGNHQVTWQAKGMASGVYFYQINFAGRRAVRKLVLTR